jgi:hypothetical protein
MDCESEAVIEELPVKSAHPNSHELNTDTARCCACPDAGIPDMQSM